MIRVLMLFISALAFSLRRHGRSRGVCHAIGGLRPASQWRGRARGGFPPAREWRGGGNDGEVEMTTLIRFVASAKTWTAPDWTRRGGITNMPAESCFFQVRSFFAMPDVDV